MADRKDVVRCAFCRRRLHDEISRLVGVGPHCAKEHGIEHSMAAAKQTARTIGEDARK